MQCNEFGFALNNSGSWLILSIYIGFWISGYYSLIVFLIHTRKQNCSLENLELEETGLGMGDLPG